MIDWLIFIPVLIGVAIQLRWTQAYLSYPKALDVVLSGIHSEYDDHIRHLQVFVPACGHAHWIMALRDVVMLAAMYLVVDGSAGYGLAVVILFVTLVPLLLGAEFSVYAARTLHRDAHALNRILRQFERTTELVDGD